MSKVRGPIAQSRSEWESYLVERQSNLREIVGRELGGVGSFGLEIGCGHGHFLTALAESEPKTTLVGIDLKGSRIERGRKKARFRKLSNVRYLRADAIEFLTALSPDIKIEYTYLLFPDPWPKTRHHKNRLVNDSFMVLLASRTIDGGAFYFRTDHKEYFQSACSVIECSSFWSIAHEADWPFEASTVFQERADSYFSLAAKKK